jgi:hypothetical protein
MHMHLLQNSGGLKATQSPPPSYVYATMLMSSMKPGYLTSENIGFRKTEV